MSGNQNINNPGTYPQTGTQTGTGTGAVPQSNTASQGGLLGMAQGWTNRVTTNLQGQTEHLKGKLGLQGTAGQGQNTTGTRTGYEPTGTGAGYGATTGTGSGYGPTGTGAGYSEYNTAGDQAGTGVPHGHNPALNQGQNYAAPNQAGAGYGATTGAGVGAAGNTAQKPSYTEQAKDWTVRVADNLHGQAEYLKGKVVGTSGTTGATATTTGTGTGTGAGYGQGTYTGQTQGGQYGTAPAGSAGYNTDPDYRAAQPGVNPTTDPQAKKSWTDSAKSWTATGLTYTQKGLEGIKNTVAGPSGSTGSSTPTGAANTTGNAYGSTAHTYGSTGNTGSAYSTTGNTGGAYSAGQPTSGTNIDPNRKY